MVTNYEVSFSNKLKTVLFGKKLWHKSQSDTL